MIRQMLTGLGGAALMFVGGVCALLTEPPWAGAVVGGALVIAGAALMTWAVGL